MLEKKERTAVNTYYFSSCKTGAVIAKCNWQIIMNFLNHLMNGCDKKRCYFIKIKEQLHRKTVNEMTYISISS